MFVFDDIIVLHQSQIPLSQNSCCECWRFEYPWEICWNCRFLVNFTIILYRCEGFPLIDTVCGPMSHVTWHYSYTQVCLQGKIQLIQVSMSEIKWLEHTIEATYNFLEEWANSHFCMDKIIVKHMALHSNFYFYCLWWFWHVGSCDHACLLFGLSEPDLKSSSEFMKFCEE
jgi:hypothetical protein